MSRIPYAIAGIILDRVEKEPPGYEAGLPMLLRRDCALWGRGT